MFNRKAKSFVTIMIVIALSALLLRLAIHKLIIFNIEQNQLIINDFHTIEELSTFSRKNNSYEAEDGKHDDLVMGLVLFAWLSDQAYFKDYTDINTLMRLRDKTEEEIMSEMLPFGFVDDGRNGMFDELELESTVGNWMMSDIENEFL